MVPALGIDATYAHARVVPGDLAFVSQSSSLMTLMIDWAATRGVGFSLLASLGDMADVHFGDLLDHLAFDARTRAVLLCIDHVAHPRKFLSAARAAARLKPVIVFSVGRSEGVGGAASPSRHPTSPPRRRTPPPPAGHRRLRIQAVSRYTLSASEPAPEPDNPLSQKHHLRFLGPMHLLR
jgi:succinyl-CoA synthetase alpha subunit